LDAGAEPFFKKGTKMFSISSLVNCKCYPLIVCKWIFPASSKVFNPKVSLL